MTIQQLRNKIKKEFESHGIPLCEANMLLEWAFDQSLATLFARLDNEVPVDIEKMVCTAAKKRCAGYPIQYITQSCGFFGLNLFCDERVLIPRFDTEILCERAIAALPQNAVIADLCCGSGAISSAILYNRPDIFCVCVDISQGALDITKKNLEKYNLQGRAKIVRADLFCDMDWKKIGLVDAIVANPPYIPTSDLAGLDPEVQKEPKIALDGGDDGMIFYEIIAKMSHLILKDSRAMPKIFFEIGYDEGDKISLTANKNKYCVKVTADLNNNDRVAEFF